MRLQLKRRFNPVQFLPGNTRTRTEGQDHTCAVDLEELPEGIRTIPGAPTAFLVPVAGPPLAGMPYPEEDVHWSEVAAAGMRRVVDLSRRPCSYDCAPLERSQFGLQDLADGGTPREEERERELIRAAVKMIAVTRRAQAASLCTVMVDEVGLGLYWARTS